MVPLPIGDLILIDSNIIYRRYSYFPRLKNPDYLISGTKFLSRKYRYFHSKLRWVLFLKDSHIKYPVFPKYNPSGQKVLMWWRSSLSPVTVKKP
jgi:hypothetical protein